MSNTPFDSFSKEVLEELLTSFGEIALNREVFGESQYVDVYFTPNPQGAANSESLGILVNLLNSPCLIEPYRNPATVDDVHSCLQKLFALQADLLRRSRRQKQPRSQVVLPQLWILTPTFSEQALAEFGAIQQPDCSSGIYRLAAALQTTIVVIHQLPATSDTLWFRLLGRGNVQRQAIHEVLQISEADPTRTQILRLLSSWKVSIEVNQHLQQEERELAMALSQAFLEWEQKTEQRGLQEGLQQGLQQGLRQGQFTVILSLLTSKFGELDLPIRSQVEALSLRQLEALSTRLLGFVSLDELGEWLDQHPPEA